MPNSVCPSLGSNKKRVKTGKFFGLCRSNLEVSNPAGTADPHAHITLVKSDWYQCLDMKEAIFQKQKKQDCRMSQVCILLNEPHDTNGKSKSKLLYPHRYSQSSFQSSSPSNVTCHLYLNVYEENPVIMQGSIIHTQQCMQKYQLIMYVINIHSNIHIYVCVYTCICIWGCIQTYIYTPYIEFMSVLKKVQSWKV